MRLGRTQILTVAAYSLGAVSLMLIVMGYLATPYPARSVDMASSVPPSTQTQTVDVRHPPKLLALKIPPADPRGKPEKPSDDTNRKTYSDRLFDIAKERPGVAPPNSEHIAGIPDRHQVHIELAGYKNDEAMEDGVRKEPSSEAGVALQERLEDILGATERKKEALEIYDASKALEKDITEEMDMYSLLPETEIITLAPKWHLTMEVAWAPPEEEPHVKRINNAYQAKLVFSTSELTNGEGKRPSEEDYAAIERNIWNHLIKTTHVQLSIPSDVASVSPVQFRPLSSDRTASWTIMPKKEVIQGSVMYRHDESSLAPLADPPQVEVKYPPDMVYFATAQPDKSQLEVLLKDMNTMGVIGWLGLFLSIVTLILTRQKLSPPPGAPEDKGESPRVGERVTPRDPPGNDRNPPVPPLDH